METQTTESGIAGVACTLIVEGRRGRNHVHSVREVYIGPTPSLHDRAKEIHDELVKEGHWNVRAYWQPMGWIEDKIPMVIFPN